MIISCNGKERKVSNIRICIESLGCSLVNDGKDDLYDLGYTADELYQHGLEMRDDFELITLNYGKS